jgi:hypothetical protein
MYYGGLYVYTRKLLTYCHYTKAIPVTAQSRAWVCDLSTYWYCGFESLLEHACLSFVSVVCCPVEVSASGWSLVERRPTECGVSECDRETLILRTWPIRDTCAMEKKKIIQIGYLVTSVLFNCLISLIFVFLGILLKNSDSWKSSNLMQTIVLNL